MKNGLLSGSDVSQEIYVVNNLTDISRIDLRRSCDDNPRAQRTERVCFGNEVGNNENSFY